ncbi:hypothetical protein PDJAM_G00232560, partial [Pangasius djambal]|nr:hypothetical protein [Pangasius djambal]
MFLVICGFHLRAFAHPQLVFVCTLQSQTTGEAPDENLLCVCFGWSWRITLHQKTLSLSATTSALFPARQLPSSLVLQSPQPKKPPCYSISSCQSKSIHHQVL